MKILKKLSFVVFVLTLTIAFSTEALAWGSSPQDQTTAYHHSGSGQTYQGRHGQGGGNAGAPLDGGLLALLAGAGAIYVAKRKKKKNAE